MGLVLLKSDTLPPDCEVSVAPVMLSWKYSTVTPLGGVSVTVIPTGVVPLDGLVFVSGEVAGDWLPHPAMNRMTTMINRASVNLRIFASGIMNLKALEKPKMPPQVADPYQSQITPASTMHTLYQISIPIINSKQAS